MTQPTSPPSDIDVDLLDPKNDFVFKKLFATSPTLLAALINAVRSDEPPIEVVEVINPRIDSDELKGKFMAFYDTKATFVLTPTSQSRMWA